MKKDVTLHNYSKESQCIYLFTKYNQKFMELTVYCNTLRSITCGPKLHTKH